MPSITDKYMIFNKPLIFAAILLVLNAGHAAAEKQPTPADIAGHSNGIWSLAPAGSLQRWIVIHNPGESGENAVFHIEVLGKEAQAPAWKITRLAAHMAVTMKALLHSVRTPMQRGLVYPEQYEDGLGRWKQEQSEGRAKLCNTDIDSCLRNEW